MNRMLWVLSAIALGGLIAMVFLAQAYLGSTSGVDETIELQDTLRVAHANLFEADPPLRVYRVPGEESGERRTWRWKVEATLRGDLDPAAPASARAFDRIAMRCAGMRPGGRAISGVILQFRRAGMPDWKREYDAMGSPLRPRPKSPPPGAPEGEAAPEAEGDGSPR